MLYLKRKQEEVLVVVDKKTYRPLMVLVVGEIESDGCREVVTLEMESQKDVLILRKELYDASQGQPNPSPYLEDEYELEHILTTKGKKNDRNPKEQHSQRRGSRPPKGERSPQ